MTDNLELLNRITYNPQQYGGKPSIRGMRIRVTDILEMLALNIEPSEILENFPDLEAEDIQACLLWAKKSTNIQKQSNSQNNLIRHHKAFLNGYSSEDEGLYDDYESSLEDRELISLHQDVSWLVASLGVHTPLTRKKIYDG